MQDRWLFFDKLLTYQCLIQSNDLFDLIERIMHGINQNNNFIYLIRVGTG
jgi:hypothetical protein